MGQVEREAMLSTPPGVNTEKPQEAGTPPRFVDPNMEVEREGLMVVLSPAPPTRPLVLRSRVDLAGPSLPCA